MDDISKSKDADALASLAGGGEMGRRIRAFDWSNTALGPVEGWPQSLRSALSICLNSNFPIAIYWGSDLVLLYNDEWSPIPGEKHPWALGRPAREAWPEIWHIIEPLFGQVMTTGEATRSRDQLLPMHRHGFTEECYFDYTFSPIRGEGGQVEGVFNAVLETTTRVIGERRLRTLRELGAWKSGEARSAEEACQNAAHIIAENPHDLPFVLLYLVDSDGRRATLAGLTGLNRDTKAAPAAVELDATDAPWPFRRVAETGLAVEVHDLPATFGPLAGWAWPEPAQRAVVLPLAKSDQAQLAGFLVAGVSPRLALNDEYRGFFDLLASHVSAAIASARAYQEERRRAEALAELDRAKTTFFSNVSHEFRTPLTLMLGPVEDILSKPADQVLPDNRELLTVIHRNGLRLQRLVNSLLDFSRIEAGRVKATFEPIDLADFTAELASNFRSACEKAGLRLTVDCPPLDEPVFVDRQMYEKVVLNLLSNAFKFTFDGEITVSLHQVGRAAVLQVRDSGTGIPGDEMPRLFERFHRVENARGRTHEGSGIGLALVHELVKQHGGAISAESVVGKGTTFTVSIPLGSQHLPREQIGTDGSTALTTEGATPFVEEALRWLPNAGGSDDLRSDLPSLLDDLSVPVLSIPHDDRPRVLVADDNADMRRYVVRLLSRSYTVEAVADGETALVSVRQQLPDLILTDVMMPRLDGFGLLRELRADPHTASVPVILLSARAGEESRVEGIQAGADDYLVKPFSAKELLARVGSLLQIARLRRESERALRASEEHLRAVVETTPACIKIVSADGTVVAMNSAGLAMVDAERTEDVYGACVYGLICAEYRDAFRQFNERVCRGEAGTMEFEIEGLRGTKRRMETHAAPLRGPDGTFRQLAITHDITDRKRADSLQGEQRNILEMIARGAPLPDVLASVCRLIEDQEPGLLCSILLTDDSGLHTGTGFGPSLPTEFVQALEGIKIAPPHTGSCCKALDCGEEVLVADIENDARWSPLWRDLNLQYGLRACRSIPILASDGAVLASVAVFRREPGDPGPANNQPLGIATHLAGAAIERRRAEDRERQLLQRAATANAQFRAFFEQGVLFAGIMNVDGTVIEANRLSMEACGYIREEVVGKMFWECPWWRSPDLVQRIKDATAQAASGETYRAEMPYFVADGSERIVDFILLPIKDESGRVTFLAPTGTDITERKRAEEALRQSEIQERLRADELETVMAAVPAVVWIAHDPACERITGNQASSDLMRLPRNTNQSVTAKVEAERPVHFKVMKDGVELHSHELPVQLAATGVEVRDFEEEIVFGDGTRIHLFGHAKPLRNETGQVRGSVAAFVDITDRKKAEQEVRKSEALFRSMADNAPAMLWVSDATGHCTYLSALWYEFTGRTPGADVGSGWLEAIHPDDLAETKRTFLRANEAHLPFSLDYRVRRQDGEYRWAVDAGLPRFDGDEFLGFVGSVFDVHDRKMAEAANSRLVESLQHADQRKDEFLATLAHELRNPLAPIRNGLQIMRLGKGDPQAIEQARTMMERQLGQMVHLVDDLLDLSRISRGKIELRKERVELAKVIQQAVETSRPLIEASGHDLTITVPPGPVYVDGDVTRLAQVFSNLLNNAAKYTERGGQVLLAMQRRGGEVAVSVKDNGVGIPAHMLPKVFEMFTQVDRHLERSQGGLGIGLSIVKRLVEMHGGSVGVESDGPNMGSEFIVRLPVVLAMAQANGSDEEPSRPSTRRKILVVDDNKDAAMSLAMMLKLMGNEAKTAHDGLEALDVAAAYRPDLILLDIGMPRLNGHETAKRIREQPWGKNVVLVALTGWGQAEDRRKSDEAGFDSHMVKPIEPAALEKLLANLQADTA